MGLLERIAADRTGPRAAYPAGAGVSAIDSEWGHDDDRFSPESYGNYLVTSNEVYSALALRARLASSLPVKLYRGDGPEKTELTAGPAWRLLRHVNPFWTWARLGRMDELSMGLWGETFWAVEKDGRGQPKEIWWLKPSRVRPVPHDKDYLKGFLYEPAGGGEPIPFRPDEVVWQRYPNPLDEFSALAPMAAARLAADTASAMMRSNRNLFTQGMQMGGFVVPKDGKVSFSNEQADDLEERLERRFKGVDKAHRWAVMRFEAQFNPQQVTPKDAEFVEGLGLTLRQVANAVGVPVPLLNDASHATLANLREYQKVLWEHALVPDTMLRAQDIEEQLLPMFKGGGHPDHAEFDYSRVPALQESQSEAWGRERQAIEVGALTINEWRKKHGHPPVPWGDVFWAPINKAPVATADERPAGPPGALDGPEARFAALVSAELDRFAANGAH